MGLLQDESHQPSHSASLLLSMPLGFGKFTLGKMILMHKDNLFLFW